MLKLKKKMKILMVKAITYIMKVLPAKPMIINKFRLLAIGVLSKNNLAKKKPHSQCKSEHGKKIKKIKIKIK